MADDVRIDADPFLPAMEKLGGDLRASQTWPHLYGCLNATDPLRDVLGRLSGVPRAVAPLYAAGSPEAEVAHRSVAAHALWWPGRSIIVTTVLRPECDPFSRYFMSLAEAGALAGAHLWETGIHRSDAQDDEKRLLTRRCAGSHADALTFHAATLDGLCQEDRPDVLIPVPPHSTGWSAAIATLEKGHDDVSSWPEADR